jgi:hypothetical protein
MNFRLIFSLFFVLLLCSCNNCYKTDRITEEKDGMEKGNQIINAVERFHFDNGKYPSDLPDLLPIYLQSIPRTITNQFFSYEIDKSDTYELTFRIACRTNLKESCTYIKRLNLWDCSVSVNDE